MWKILEAQRFEVKGLVGSMKLEGSMTDGGEDEVVMEEVGSRVLNGVFFSAVV